MLLDNFLDFDFSRYRLPVITIYRQPSDFPEHFVARLFDIDVRTEFFVLKKYLEDIRNAIPKRFARMPRDPLDDPVIFEIWL